MLVQRVRTRAVDAPDSLHPTVSHVLEIEDGAVHVGDRLCVNGEILEAHSGDRESIRPPCTRGLTRSPVLRIQSRRDADGPGTAARD